MTTHPDSLRPALDWTDEGAPRSRAFDDIYFQPEEGLEESRTVFLRGCGLPEAWRGRDRFVVGELGFGTGLNVLALLDLWRRESRPPQRLHVFSVEAFPLSVEEARRALAAWPELADLARMLLAGWPRRARGFHRLELPGLRAVIDVGIGEAAEQLQAWAGRADAWFLDGFAPAKNPQMWREEVLALVAAQSAPGARAATFTVAGHVRRGLAACGFQVERVPGHGRKRQRLEARLPGGPPAPSDPGGVAVIGGGVAAAALVRAFAGLGVQVRQFAGAGRGASGNPAALVSPGLDAGERPPGRLYAQALARAADLYRATTPAAVIAQGALQLERDSRDGPRFDRIAMSGLFAPGAVVRLSAAEVAERLGEPSAPAGLLIAEALVVEPGRILEAWGAPDAQPVEAASLERRGEAWRLLDGEGRLLAEADTVCVAAGAAAAGLTGVPLERVRGQASWTDGVFTPAAAWGGYAIPTRTGLLFGATHDRGPEGVEVRDEDHRRNLEQLRKARPVLAAAMEGRPLAGRAALRATTRDRLPAAGAAPSGAGLHILGGLGSRGFTSAPLLAEHVAATVVGAPSPLPADLAAAVDPLRLSGV